MKKEFLGWRTVVFSVSDLTAAKQWYTEALGLAPYFDQPFYVGFSVAGYELGLAPTDKPITHGTNIDAYLGVADARSSYERLITLGAARRTEPQDVGEGIIVATVTDPFGNTLGVIENPHFMPET